MSMLGGYTRWSGDDPPQGRNHQYVPLPRRLAFQLSGTPPPRPALACCVRPTTVRFMRPRPSPP